ncbi:DNA binding methylated-DNA--cysteine S-methyltransferase [Gigaspora margarita]|uniref:Methylated-DNA--protein-cysteine methyltransferase n=1 Tax=Gigaspora margarita TaxID=4874 RepID=A0A8H3XCA0_GIGMA|nr:DNA binding methylated-DNA--cysteine S-methyltransferase [Gigaspora margarita]
MSTLLSISNHADVGENNSTSLLQPTNNDFPLEIISLKNTSPITYPSTKSDRLKFINPKTGRIVTEFQYKVYDLCAQIPEGFVSTYKLLATALKSSPRAVGGALRVNPFAPLPIPCHRVIASDFFIGGFDGEWFNRQHQNNDTKKRNYNDSIMEDKIGCKLDRLKKEGIFFDKEGWLQEDIGRERKKHIKLLQDSEKVRNKNFNLCLTCGMIVKTISALQCGGIRFSWKELKPLVQDNVLQENFENPINWKDQASSNIASIKDIIKGEKTQAHERLIAKLNEVDVKNPLTNNIIDLGAKLSSNPR